MTEERKKVEKVVKGQVKTVKKGVVERLVLHMIGPDGIRAIGRQLGHEIVMPAIKNILADSITSGARMAIFGENERPSNTYTGGYSNPYRGYGGHQASPSARGYNYASQYEQTKAQVGAPRNQAFRSSIPTYFLETREEAADVLRALAEQIDAYQVATLNDYYDLIGVDGNYTDYQWGWRNIEYARILVGTEGFFIEFPKLEKVS